MALVHAICTFHCCFVCVFPSQVSGNRSSLRAGAYCVILSCVAQYSDKQRGGNMYFPSTPWDHISFSVFPFDLESGALMYLIAIIKDNSESYR